MTNYMRPKEAANRLSITKRTLAKWARDGRITAHRITPRTVRYAEADIERLARGEK